MKEIPFLCHEALNHGKLSADTCHKQAKSRFLQSVSQAYRFPDLLKRERNHKIPSVLETLQLVCGVSLANLRLTRIYTLQFRFYADTQAPQYFMHERVESSTAQISLSVLNHCWSLHEIPDGS